VIYELRCRSLTELQRVFGQVIGFEFLGHCDVRPGEGVVRFSTLPGHEAELLRRLPPDLPGGSPHPPTRSRWRDRIGIRTP
jgi:hypothetical protein